MNAIVSLDLNVCGEADVHSMFCTFHPTRMRFDAPPSPTSSNSKPMLEGLLRQGRKLATAVPRLALTGPQAWP